MNFRLVESAPIIVTTHKDLDLARHAHSQKTRKMASVFGQPTQDVLDQVNSDKLTLFCTDFCPFAARAWLAILEKEEDPTSPILFDYITACYPLGTKDPGTKMLKEGLGRNTVPSAVHNGQTLGESTLLANYIDDYFQNNPLKPSDPLLKYNMGCFMEEHGKIVSAFYGLLMSQDESAHAGLKEKLSAILSTVNDDLQKFAGPYLCGEQFTMADINLVPFIERIVLLLPLYRNFSIPEDLNYLHEWYNTVKQRPAVAVAFGNPTEECLAVSCFESTTREEYIQEVYEPYSLNDVAAFKEAQTERGAPGINAWRRERGAVFNSPSLLCSSLFLC